MWQWAIHVTGLLASSSMSTVEPEGTNTVSFQARFVFFTPSFSRTKNLWPWKCIGCCIGCGEVGSLNSLIFTLSPCFHSMEISMFCSFVSMSSIIHFVMLSVIWEFRSEEHTSELQSQF